ncbi:MAG: glycosyltransferase family 39 protein [Anaerolineaceae bacterium]|nr:glycosyltransferase family 39 protein [Anaerolineaceae bacterium]
MTLPEFEHHPSETDTPDALETTPSEQPVNVEDMTLAGLIGQFFHHPILAFQAFVRVAQSARPQGESEEKPIVTPAFATGRRSRPLSGFPGLSADSALSAEEQAARRRLMTQWVIWFISFVVALVGSAILATDRQFGEDGLNKGVLFLMAGFVLWLVGELYGSWPVFTVSRETRQTSANSTPAIQDESPNSIASLESESQAEDAGISREWLIRAMLASAGTAASLLAWQLNAHNHFTLPGVIAWWVSIPLWVFTVAPAAWTPTAMWQGIRRFRLPKIRGNWVIVTLLVIMGVGLFFRVNNLQGIPPEMTSDHLEKLLDSQRVLDGETQVFFPNNGGREGFQMYAMALFSRLPGLSMDFTTLKLLTALEGVITLPVMWWMGRRIVNKDEARLGNIIGLLLAALVAVSYWHVALSRLALRIVLTPLVTALLLGFLASALRYNRRGDYIKAGLVLGVGLYTYQAVRMLPVVVVAGVVLAFLFKARSWLDRWRYVVNLGLLALIAFVVFVPLFEFSLEQPQYFWMRTFGRLLGDEVIQTTDDAGNLVERTTTIQERLEAFQSNLPILAGNVRNALLMYNWKGDVAWINGAPNKPAMDMFTGALLVVGGAAWLARMFRRRDVVDWLLPLALFILVFPSALSIAYPIENPSATRMSATLPEAYLFAALPLALLVTTLMRIMPGVNGRRVATWGVVALLALAYGVNANTYFNDYRVAYLGSAPAPYTEAGNVLTGFAESGGSYGNAFMIAYTYWWGHREIGAAAGLLDWPNGITDRSLVPQFLYDSWSREKYPFDPNRDILFFFSPEDTDTERQLYEWFPNGYAQIFDSYRVGYRPSDQYGLFRVPALGRLGFDDFLRRTGVME